MIVCKWCGKRIAKFQPKVTLSKGMSAYDHIECNRERVKSFRERSGIELDFTKGQTKLV